MGVMVPCEIYESILTMVQFLSNFNEIQYHEADFGETDIQTEFILV
jgi:hypothetical protein